MRTWPGIVLAPVLALADQSVAYALVKWGCDYQQFAALQWVQQGLFAGTHSLVGTSLGVFGGFPIPIAGKTGTAEKGPGRPDQSWYVALAPYPDVKYVVVVTAEHGGFGADTAAPEVRKILAKLFGVKDKGHALEYTFDTQAERTGVTSLIAKLSELGITFRDLDTKSSSLEDIFVSLVHSKDEAPAKKATQKAG